VRRMRLGAVVGRHRRVARVSHRGRCRRPARLRTSAYCPIPISECNLS
jgi:hypothetical protein